MEPNACPISDGQQVHRDTPPATLGERESRNRRRSLPTLSLLVLAIAMAACVGQSSAMGPSPAGPGDPAATDLRAAASPGASAVSPVALPSAPPTPVASDRPVPTPGPSVPRVPVLQPPAYASRVVVPSLGIDLPVISGDLQPPPSYPFCDVAAYVTRFNQPYEPGITYISAHAQRGMFLPLLEASRRADGAEMLGQAVDVYTDDGRRFGYRIDRVVRHALDYAVTGDISLEARHLILQTSTRSG